MENFEREQVPKKPVIERVVEGVVEFFSLFVEVDPNIGEAGLREQGLAQAREDQQHQKNN